MNCLEERILKDGIVKEGNVLKVDSFLNHQMDIDLFNEMGNADKRPYSEFQQFRHGRYNVVCPILLHNIRLRRGSKKQRAYKKLYYRQDSRVYDTKNSDKNCRQNIFLRKSTTECAKSKKYRKIERV